MEKDTAGYRAFNRNYIVGDKTMSNSIKDSVQAFAVNQVLIYVDCNPQDAFT